MMNNILNFLEKLGASFRGTLFGLGSGARLFFLTIIYSSDSFKRFNLTIKEIYFTGVLSLVIIVVSAFFVGMVLGLQGYYTLEKYGSSEAIGVLVALALVRELGPVVTALLFAGRAGTAITAEIGLMKTTEQLSAMEMMAVSPIARIVAPRFWAGMISMPILATVFSMVGILGGYFIAVLVIGVDDGAFWSQMQANVDFHNDIVDGAIKSVVFGFTCTLIALYQGLVAPPTAEGVSRATTKTVVISSLSVLGLDFVLTSFMFV